MQKKFLEFRGNASITTGRLWSRDPRTIKPPTLTATAAARPWRTCRRFEDPFFRLDHSSIFGHACAHSMAAISPRSLIGGSQGFPSCAIRPRRDVENKYHFCRTATNRPSTTTGLFDFFTGSKSPLTVKKPPMQAARLQRARAEVIKPPTLRRGAPWLDWSLSCDGCRKGIGHWPSCNAHRRQKPRRCDRQTACDWEPP